MKDYRNYHNLSINDKIKHDGIVSFQAQLDKEGQDVVIDGVSTRAIIRESGNPLNELKEERKFMCLSEIVINRGSVVRVNDSLFLVVSEVDDNTIYKRAKITKTNHILKLMIDGHIREIPCILGTKSLIVLGASQIRENILPNGEISIRMSSNDITSRIDYNENNRFIIGKTAWHVIDIDDMTQKGIINLTVERQSVLSTVDNTNLNVANYENQKAEIKVLNGTNVITQVSSITPLNIQVFVNKTLVEMPELVYSSSDESIVTVDDGGMIQALDEGQAIITITCGESSVNVTVDVIGEVIIPSLSLDIIGLDKVKVGNNATYTCTPLQNGLPIPMLLNATWCITNMDGVSSTDLAVVSISDNNKCDIKVNTNFKLGKFLLWYMIDENTKSYKEIQVIARF